jgi:uncharacterized protein YfbU (UPF0304 family)
MFKHLKWFDQIMEALESKDEDDESIKELRIMLDGFQFNSNKDSFISFVSILSRKRSFYDNKKRKSK